MFFAEQSAFALRQRHDTTLIDAKSHGIAVLSALPSLKSSLFERL
jgi:hypothetical protein